MRICVLVLRVSQNGRTRTFSCVAVTCQSLPVPYAAVCHTLYAHSYDTESWVLAFYVNAAWLEP